MKKLTKRLMGVAMSVAAVCMMGCNLNLGGHNIIEGAVDGATVNYTNETKAVQRELCRTKLKHHGGIYKITQEINFTADGMMGIVFGLDDSKKDDMSFFVVGTSIQYGKESGYISYFTHIDEASLDDKNFGVDPSNVVTTSKSDADNKQGPAEWEILALSNQNPLIKDTNGFLKDNKYEVQIAVYPTFSNNNYDGSYTVAIYPATEDLEFDEHKQVKDKNATQSIIIEGVYDECKDLNDVPQGLIGYYVNVYAGNTLTGSWSLPSKNVISEVITE